jgi:hypothetical protein
MLLESSSSSACGVYRENCASIPCNWIRRNPSSDWFESKSFPLLIVKYSQFLWTSNTYISTIRCSRRRIRFAAFSALVRSKSWICYQLISADFRAVHTTRTSDSSLLTWSSLIVAANREASSSAAVIIALSGTGERGCGSHMPTCRAGERGPQKASSPPTLSGAGLLVSSASLWSGILPFSAPRMRTSIRSTWEWRAVTVRSSRELLVGFDRRSTKSLSLSITMSLLSCVRSGLGFELNESCVGEENWRCKIGKWEIPRWCRDMARKEHYNLILARLATLTIPISWSAVFVQRRRSTSGGVGRWR